MTKRTDQLTSTWKGCHQVSRVDCQHKLALSNVLGQKVKNRFSVVTDHVDQWGNCICDEQQQQMTQQAQPAGAALVNAGTQLMLSPMGKSAASGASSVNNVIGSPSLLLKGEDLAMPPLATHQVAVKRPALLDLNLNAGPE